MMLESVSVTEWSRTDVKTTQIKCNIYYIQRIKRSDQFPIIYIIMLENKS